MFRKNAQLLQSILLLLFALTLTWLSIHLIYTTPTTSNIPSNQEVLYCYTSEGIQEEIYKFDSFTLSLVPQLLESSPLSASFMYGDLSVLGLENLAYQLDDLSYAAFGADLNQAKAILEALQSMDYTLLTKEQRNTYDLVLFQNQLIIEGSPYYYYDALIEPSSGLQINLPLALIQLELTDQMDIEAYLSRLTQVKRLLLQAADFETLRAQKGLLLPRELYDVILQEIDDLLVEPENFMLYVSFCESLDAIQTISEPQKTIYKAQCLSTITQEIYPAYATLKNTLFTIQEQAHSDLGVSSWENGAAYYNYIIKKETSYDMDAEALMTWVNTAITESVSEIHTILTENPDLQNLASLQSQLPTYVSMEEIYAIQDQCLEDQFYDYNILSATENIIPKYLEDYVASGFYFPVALDGEDYGTMYLRENTYMDINTSTLELYFHENIPGHHFYFSKFYSSDLPLIRKIYSWLPYEEGWAQYIQNLSIDYYGLEAPLSNLLKASSKLSYYYMLLLDARYHYEGISSDEVLATYLELGFTEASAQKALMRMIAHPGEIIHYIYGEYKIESYLKQCQTALTSNFDIKDFHDMILNHAELPFTTMDTVILEYISEKTNTPN